MRLPYLLRKRRASPALAVTSLRKMSKVLLPFSGERSLAVSLQSERVFHELSEHRLTPFREKWKSAQYEFLCGAKSHQVLERRDQQHSAQHNLQRKLSAEILSTIYHNTM